VISGWPFYASVAVLGCECIAFFFGGSSEWGNSTDPAQYRIDSGEVAEQARFAIELYAIGALNLLASIPFLLRRWGWAWWLVLGMQVGGFVFAQVEAWLIDPADGVGWFYVSGLPLLTFFLLLAFRMAQARLKPVHQEHHTWVLAVVAAALALAVVATLVFGVRLWLLGLLP
jgi:hypothetical protein